MTDSADSYLGRQLGNVRIERLLGEGELGRVYLGTELTLERPVAVKLVANPAHAQRLRDVARLTAPWRHPHIIQVYYVNQEAEVSAIVMEYIAGQDLGALLAEYRAAGLLLPHEHVLLLGQALASALDYAHGKGVVHRNLKPSNVLIGHDDRIVLTDFGLALDQQRGSAGNIYGSPRYMAPEQARSSAAAIPQSDLYALAVLLYELLTGRLPFDDAAPLAVALKHVTQQPPSPRQLNPALNRETEAVLLRGLSKNPAERYPSGAELLRALETALATSPSVSLQRRSEAIAAPTPAPDRAPEDDPLIGTELDCYHVEALVGIGGMARIYRGRDTRLQRSVALKVIDQPYQDDPEYTERFTLEAQAIASLDHPNIVHLYYYGEANGLLYMVMQYIEGQDLQSLLAEERAHQRLLPPEQQLKIVRNIAFALDYAHSQGVIHRDVHPGNILIDQRGRAILTDFGLALMTAVGTRGEIFGTPHYMAPEQAESSAKAVPESDLYALGVIVYEMTTGQLPYEGTQPVEIALKHITEDPRPAREANPEMSPALEAVIMRTLAKAPADRYSTGAALAAALAQALQQ